jgi:hypothetical protein
MTSALTTYENRVQEKVELLLSAIDREGSKARNMDMYCMFFGFDVMSQVGELLCKRKEVDPA